MSVEGCREAVGCEWGWSSPPFWCSVPFPPLMPWCPSPSPSSPVQDVAGRVPSASGSSPLDALDLTKANWPIFAEGAEKHLREVKVRGGESTQK